jgi:hypothetical protein
MSDPNTAGGPSEAGAPEAELGRLPQCVYFYHLSADPSSSDPVRVRAYFHDEKRDITPAAVDGLANTLLRNARNGTIHPAGYGLGDLRWRRVSYLVFVVDGALGGLDGIGLPEGHLSFGPKFKVGSLDQADGVAYLNKLVRGQNAGNLPGGRWQETFRMEAHPSMAKSLLDHEDSGTNMGPPVPPPM